MIKSLFVSLFVVTFSVNLCCGGTEDNNSCEPVCAEKQICKEGKCVPCKPGCGNRECGLDECGNSCGKCSTSQVCEDGKCLATTCTKDCPKDCGNCSGNTECDPNGKCIALKACDPVCKIGEHCRDGKCLTSICGVGDNCLADCTCPVDTVCSKDGECVKQTICTPKISCTELQCGNDSCGVSCKKTCKSNEICSSGKCLQGEVCSGDNKLCFHPKRCLFTGNSVKCRD